ncbi:molybdopterin converting factor subunit 1 [Bacillus sp. 03113]|uniref:molybdopterin converting factor subunit 1 n=1 Tax=Bacillus sp. 03113 TaxID=2578211 RepID=UPI00114455CE|nr:molybdopterin converting factor subunit 1 [Bacillus sp. 03113]
MNKILFFAHLKETVGEEKLVMDVQGKTVSEVKKILIETYPSIQLNSAMTAINEEFAMDQDVIQESDEIAFIPPVSGG